MLLKELARSCPNAKALIGDSWITVMHRATVLRPGSGGRRDYGVGDLRRPIARRLLANALAGAFYNSEASTGGVRITDGAIDGADWSSKRGWVTLTCTTPKGTTSLRMLLRVPMKIWDELQ